MKVKPQLTKSFKEKLSIIYNYTSKVIVADLNINHHTSCGQGRGWLSKCGCPPGKKIIAAIFVKFTQIIWQ